ncbi:hypothetical protein CR513_02609, partial [Mucuna pruriens]
DEIDSRVGRTNPSIHSLGTTFWKRDRLGPYPSSLSSIGDPPLHLQAFQTQAYINRDDNAISCKLFLDTLRGVCPRSIHTFNELAIAFMSQFATNHATKIEVVDLFDIKQTKGESLKKYLAQYNSNMVQVNDPRQKFFVKAFQKGLRAEQFSVSLVLRWSANMEEIRA